MPRTRFIFEGHTIESRDFAESDNELQPDTLYEIKGRIYRIGATRTNPVTGDLTISLGKHP